jgi:hypothetical protein
MTALDGPPRPAESGKGWYVYGVVPTANAGDASFEGVEGVAGGPVALVDGGRLAAIASEVPLSDFGEESIAENLRNPAWLEERVRAHESVLDAALSAVPVVPFRFGTIYRGEDHVREMLSAHDRLNEALERVRGRVELGVKGFLEAPAADGEPTTAEEQGTSAGRQYLERKQHARRLAEEQDALKARWAEESHRRLADAADAATANPLQPREISGRDAEMFLNGAYLVAKERQREFGDALAKLESELGPSGARYELTGPWPPYNFVEDPA